MLFVRHLNTFYQTCRPEFLLCDLVVIRDCDLCSHFYTSTNNYLYCNYISRAIFEAHYWMDYLVSWHQLNTQYVYVMFKLGQVPLDEKYPLTQIVNVICTNNFTEINLLDGFLKRQ